MDNNGRQSRKLYRSNTDRIVWGVCGGLGEYFDIDSIIFRIIFVALVLGAGSGVLVYIVLALLVPKRLKELEAESSKINIKDRAEGLASELKGLGNPSSGKRNVLGWGIVILGIVLLLNELLPWRVFSWDFFWPVVIVGVGVLLLRGKGKMDSDSVDNNTKSPEENLTDTSIPTQDPARETVREIHHYHKQRGGGIFRLFFGLILFIVGLGFLAQNFNLIPGLTIDMFALFRFWPVFIVLAGLSLISRGTWVGRVLSTIITVAIIILIVAFFVRPGGTPNQLSTFPFDFPKENITKQAEVSIDAGASVINITGGASGLVSGNLETNVTTLKTESALNGTTQKVTIKSEGRMRRFIGSFKNNLTVALADNIPFSLDVDSGASDITLDASTLLLQNLKLDTGASKVKVIFGDKLTTAQADINAGVSSVEIVLPEGLGAKLKVGGAMLNKNFVGFKEISDDLYESDNYSTAVKKIDITIDAGVSSVSVVRK